MEGPDDRPDDDSQEPTPLSVVPPLDMAALDGTGMEDEDVGDDEPPEPYWPTTEDVENGTAETKVHRPWTPEEAREMGRKGGKARWAKQAAAEDELRKAGSQQRLRLARAKRAFPERADLGDLAETVLIGILDRFLAQLESSANVTAANRGSGYRIKTPAEAVKIADLCHKIMKMEEGAEASPEGKAARDDLLADLRDLIVKAKTG